jgi:hypothetical protein
MKKIAALALMAVMATAGVATVSDSASAHPGPWMYPHAQYHPGWGWGGRSNFYFGFGNPFYYLPPPPPPPAYGYYYGGNAHVRWCLSRYRTYNPATDSFFIRPGVPARCVAPFDYGYGY